MKIPFNLCPFYFLLLFSGTIHPALSAQNPRLSFLEVKILVPAEEKIDPPVHSILVLPGSSLISCSFSGIEPEGNILEIKPEPSSLASQTIHRFSEVLQTSPTFKLNTDSTGIQPGSGHFLTWQAIDSLCAQKKTEALLCLERIDINSNARTNDYSVLYHYPDYSGEFSDSYYYSYQYFCDYITSAFTQWRLYIPGKRQVKGWNIQISDTCKGAYSGSTHKDIFCEKDIQMLKNRIAFLSGRRFAFYISPTWITVQRAFYESGNRDMKKAAKLIRKGKVKEAASLWKKVARSSHGRVSKYAQFNLILVSEIRGQAEEAYQAALNLWKISKLPEASIYAEILKTCMEDERKVREQIKP